jgi:hypothetical protein
MSTKDNGGPAFPTSDPNYEQRYAGEGMSLRDYFAVHAGYEDVKAQAEVIRMELINAGDGGILPDGWHCKARYMHADAMLKARTE